MLSSPLVVCFYLLSVCVLACLCYSLSMLLSVCIGVVAVAAVVVVSLCVPLLWFPSELLGKPG